MQMKKLKKCMLLLLCVALIAALALTMTGCNRSGANNSVAFAEGGEMGKGETTFQFIVTDGDGKQTNFQIYTDKTTVGDALMELGLIEGEVGEFGLYVKTVNGITADFDTDGTYWAFYVNGEYATAGVDTTDIEAGATYAMKVEK